MGVVKVYITNQQKAVKIPSGLRLLIRKCCHAVLEMENFGKPAEVSVTFVDNKEIQTLNREYRQKDAPTDVLSFPMGENGEYDLNEDTGAYILGGHGGCRTGHGRNEQLAEILCFIGYAVSCRYVHSVEIYQKCHRKP